MKLSKHILKDGVFMLTVLVTVFLVNLFLVEQFQTKTMTPMVFVLGVFLVSWRTQGYFWGIAAPCSTFAVDDLFIDYDRRQVSVDGKLIHLTQTEYNILALLSQHTGKVMTYTSIIRAIWGSMDDGSIKKLQVNMANIRKKLGCRPGDNRYVINELGVGYRMLDE